MKRRLKIFIILVAIVGALVITKKGGNTLEVIATNLIPIGLSH